jgi:hypothetical protein
LSAAKDSWTLQPLLIFLGLLYDSLLPFRSLGLSFTA